MTNPTQDKQYEVALSFAGEDRERAFALAQCLSKGGVRVFYDEFEQASLWGKDLVEYLHHVYSRGARFVVLLLSRHYKEKAWPRLERQAAFSRLLDSKIRDTLLPVRLDDTEIPGLPSTISYVPIERGIPVIAALLMEKLGRIPPENRPGEISTSGSPAKFRYFDVGFQGDERVVHAKVALGKEYQLLGTAPDALPVYFAERDYLLASNRFVQWQTRSFMQSFTACVAVIRIAKNYADIVDGIAAGGRDYDPPQTWAQIMHSPGLFSGLQEARAILGLPAIQHPLAGDGQ